MITTILDVAKFLFDTVSGISKNSEKKREKISIYCEGISACLEKIVINYDNNKPSISDCNELNYFADSFVETVTGIIDKQQSVELAKALHNSTMNRAFIYLKFSPEYRNEISQASGLFKAVANTIRAKK